jgi:hypothetical protein
LEEAKASAVKKTVITKDIKITLLFIIIAP